MLKFTCTQDHQDHLALQCRASVIVTVKNVRKTINTSCCNMRLCLSLSPTMHAMLPIPALPSDLPLCTTRRSTVIGMTTSEATIAGDPERYEKVPHALLCKAFRGVCLHRPAAHSGGHAQAVCMCNQPGGTEPRDITRVGSRVFDSTLRTPGVSPRQRRGQAAHCTSARGGPGATAHHPVSSSATS